MKSHPGRSYGPLGLHGKALYCAHSLLADRSQGAVGSRLSQWASNCWVPFYNWTRHKHTAEHTACATCLLEGLTFGHIYSNLNSTPQPCHPHKNPMSLASDSNVALCSSLNHKLTILRNHFLLKTDSSTFLMETNSSLETRHTIQRPRRMTYLYPLSSETMSYLPPPALPPSSAIGHVSQQASQWLKAAALFPRDFLVCSPWFNQKIKITHYRRQGLTPPWKGQALPNNFCYIPRTENLKNSKALLHLAHQCARQIFLKTGSISMCHSHSGRRDTSVLYLSWCLW